MTMLVSIRCDSCNVLGGEEAGSGAVVEKIRTSLNTSKGWLVRTRGTGQDLCPNCRPAPPPRRPSARAKR